MATIILTAKFKNGVTGNAHIDVDHIKWEPHEMGRTIEQDALPRELWEVAIHTDKGTATSQTMPFIDVRIPLSLIAFGRDD